MEMELFNGKWSAVARFDADTVKACDQGENSLTEWECVKVLSMMCEFWKEDEFMYNFVWGAIQEVVKGRTANEK